MGGTALATGSPSEDSESRPSSLTAIIVSPENVGKYFLYETAAFVKLFKEDSVRISELFKTVCDANVDYSNKSHDLYFIFLKHHLNALNISYTNRDGWVTLCTKYFSSEVQSKLQDMETNREAIRQDYWSKVEKLGNNKASYKEFFTLTKETSLIKNLI